jgi:hypothetical protein
MIISRCCKKAVYVKSIAGESFYICGKCHVSCDTLCSLGLMGEDHDDPTREVETQAAIG